MYSLFKKKKGTIFDLMIMGIVLVVLAIALVVINYAFDTIDAPLSEDFVERNETQADEILTRANTEFPSIFDGAFVFLFLGIWMASLISSFFIDSHPIFFIISLFILIPILVVLVYLNNFYIETLDIAEFITYQTKMPMMYWIASHLFMILIVVGGTILVALYAKLVNQ